jgi:hypothetical protein
MEDKGPKKLSISKETLRNLRIKTALKTGYMSGRSCDFGNCNTQQTCGTTGQCVTPGCGGFTQGDTCATCNTCTCPY